MPSNFPVAFQYNDDRTETQGKKRNCQRKKTLDFLMKEKLNRLTSKFIFLNYHCYFWLFLCVVFHFCFHLVLFFYAAVFFNSLEIPVQYFFLNLWADFEDSILGSGGRVLMDRLHLWRSREEWAGELDPPTSFYRQIRKALLWFLCSPYKENGSQKYQ